MSKLWTGAEPRIDYLRRLAVVFAVDLRIKIVTELYQREMSPKQFFMEFGGGSISRVDKNFKKLAKHGWLRYLRSETGDGRRGARENFYRATGLAFIDTETWKLLPYSMRVAISWRTFRLFAEKVNEALLAGSFSSLPGSGINRDVLSLDQQGWDNAMAALDGLFGSLFEEQEDARLRMAHSGESPVIATLGLAGFESAAEADDGHDPRTPRLVPVSQEPPVPVMSRVAKVFKDELCLSIVSEANRREISAPLFHAELGGESIERIRRCFKKVEAAGWLRQINQKTGGRRRSAVELFYRATSPAIAATDARLQLSPELSALPDAVAFEGLSRQVREAILVGTFEARLDDHLSWSVLRLDQEAWRSAVTQVEAVRQMLLKEEQAAIVRLRRSGEAPITTTIGLAAFRSPDRAAREP